jgi:hypothetical protein
MPEGDEALTPNRWARSIVVTGPWRRSIAVERWSSQSATALGREVLRQRRTSGGRRQTMANGTRPTRLHSAHSGSSFAMATKQVSRTKLTTPMRILHSRRGDERFGETCTRLR